MTDQTVERTRLSEVQKVGLDTYGAIKEMVKALEDQSDDEARETIVNSALEVSIRSDWHNPFDEDDHPSEYRILITTGGPAARVAGKLNEDYEPKTAILEVQDWFLPWTDWLGEGVEDDREEITETLLTFASQFWFGE